MGTKYCNLCERKIEPVKKFNWVLFLLLFITGIGPVIYIVWYLLLGSKNRCPLCGTKDITWKIPEKVEE